ncbi:MAG: hypothetical protein GX263_07945 [Firmicutes bacterium]|jgi:NADH-quinone oxidoreductase subunit F|nr:hypothetical protein [Bacillota bacterium]
MMKRFIDHCCDKCFHSKENPCKLFIECCLSGPLCHDSDECSAKRKAIIERVAHSPGYLNF